MLKGTIPVDRILEILNMSPDEVRQDPFLQELLDRNRSTVNELLVDSYSRAADQLAGDPEFMGKFAALGIEPKHGR